MAEASETTPLLSDTSTGLSRPYGEHNEQHDAYSPDPTPELLPPFFRATFILTWLSVAFSLLTFAFAVTVGLMDKYSPHTYYMGWDIRDVCSAILVVSVCTALISLVNLARLYKRRRALWLWLNLFLDVVITYYFFGICLQGLSVNFEPYSHQCSTSAWDATSPDYDAGACGAFAKRMRILTGIALGWGLVLAIVHLILFLMRCVLAYRSKFWQRIGTWRFPTGQFTVEFTVKLLRQEEGAGSREEGQQRRLA